MKMTRSCRGPGHAGDPVIQRTRSCRGPGHADDPVMQMTRSCRGPGHADDPVMQMTRSCRWPGHADDPVMQMTRSCRWPTTVCGVKFYQPPTVMLLRKPNRKLPIAVDYDLQRTMASELVDLFEGQFHLRKTYTKQIHARNKECKVRELNPVPPRHGARPMPMRPFMV